MSSRFKSPAYVVWRKMKERCLNPNCIYYERYGGRGISVCDRWLLYDNFLEDMGVPEKGHQLDRIDNDGDYEPGNCRWVTARENANNRSSNIRFTYKGKIYNIMQASEKFGISYKVLHARIQVSGWSIERAIEEPINFKVLKFRYKGVVYTLQTAAKKFGISRSVLHQRIFKLGWSFRKAISVPTNDYMLKYRYKGEIYTISELSAEYKVPYEALRIRLRDLKWPISKAISVPVKKS